MNYYLSKISDLISLVDSVISKNQNSSDQWKIQIEYLHDLLQKCEFLLQSSNSNTGILDGFKFGDLFNGIEESIKGIFLYNEFDRYSLDSILRDVDSLFEMLNLLPKTSDSPIENNKNNLYNEDIVNTKIDDFHNFLETQQNIIHKNTSIYFLIKYMRCF